MIKHLAVVAITLGALAAGNALPAAQAAPCRALPFAGCAGTDDSPSDPRSAYGGKKSPHQAGNPSDPKTGHPPIRFR
jgi:hypothetical protein